jgi:hypothetical protein
MNTGKRFFKYIKFLIPVILLVFILLCSQISALAEWYMRCCYPAIATVISFFTRLLPFSLLDWLIIAAIVMFPVSIVLVVKRRLLFRRWCGLLLLSGLWITVWFYMFWGIGYFRQGFHERFGVEAPKEDREFFEAMVVRYIDSLNVAYVAEPHFDADEINREIETIYAALHEKLRLPYPCGWRRTKKTLTEPLMTRTGIAGYFGPFFNEVHVNNFMLPVSYPYTLAHEKAHQLGIASEAECNFYATVICTSSKHPLVHYSGYLKTVSYLLGNLKKISPERYRETVMRIDPRIIADYNAIRERWQKAISETLSAMQDRVYDAYLKTNKQQSGIMSYSEMTGLLVTWEEISSSTTFCVE